MPLDDIDRQILRALYKNGRESLSGITEKVHKIDQEPMSHTGIRKRITKLMSLGLLKIQGNINVKNLKYHAVIILMEMKNYEELRKLIKVYSTCPRIFFLTQVTGRYNLIIGVIGQDLSVLQRYLNYCGPTNRDGVLHSEILNVAEFALPNFIPINLFVNSENEKKCENICEECEAFLNEECKGCGKFY